MCPIGMHILAGDEYNLYRGRISANNRADPSPVNNLKVLHYVILIFILKAAVYLQCKNDELSKALDLSPTAPINVFPRRSTSIASCLLPSKKLFLIVRFTEAAPS